MYHAYVYKSQRTDNSDKSVRRSFCDWFQEAIVASDGARREGKDVSPLTFSIEMDRCKEMQMIHFSWMTHEKLFLPHVLSVLANCQ